MPCYFHRFTGTQPGCLACGADNAFWGGFGRGLYLWPQNIFKGIAGADRPNVVQADKELRAVAALYRERESLREDIQQARQLYGSLPSGVKAGIELGAIESMGGLTCGFILNSLISAFAGRSIANYMGARLGSQHRILARTPATALVGGLLTYFSIVATTQNLMEAQNRLLEQHPDARETFDEALDKLTKKDGSGKHQ